MFRPPPRLTISEWAERFRQIERGASAEAGKFHVDRLPYQRGMLDSPCDPEVLETVYLMGKQLGKTECINNLVGFYIHWDPSPILVVYPTLDSAKAWSKSKFMPMVRATQPLAQCLMRMKSRDSDNTILHKRFPGGEISVSGANSPSGLRQRSKRVVVQDEIDAMEPNAEGDPCELADGRAENFHNAVFVKSSTPTLKGLSRIEGAFQRTDQRYFFVPCHACGAMQILRWCQVKWPEGKPAEAFYECEQCKSPWTDADRINAVKRGEWRATAQFAGRRGFHLSGLYRIMGKKRIFRSYLHEFADGFLKSKSKGKFALMVWVNTFLAETWEDEAENIEGSHIFKRREDYLTPAGIPNGVLLVTAGVDVQGDRLEAEAIGWGDGEESWGLGVKVFPGNPLSPGVWRDLDEWLTSESWRRVDGVTLRIASAGIDTGGQVGGEGWSDTVHGFCKPRFARRIYAVKGSNVAGRPIAANPIRGNRRRCPVFMIGTDTAKGLIYGRLKLEEKGPGYMHFPTGIQHGYTEDWFKGLTAEKIITEHVKGFPKRRWVKIPGRRNEPLDVRVYATAAMCIFQPKWRTLKKQVAERALRAQKDSTGVSHPQPVDAATEQPTNQEQSQPAPAVRRARRSSFIGGFST
jgi:phage terminase large subunit GpA-like protein